VAGAIGEFCDRCIGGSATMAVTEAVPRISECSYFPMPRNSTSSVPGK
jgi:hypothetical protein